MTNKAVGKYVSELWLIAEKVMLSGIRGKSTTLVVCRDHYKRLLWYDLQTVGLNVKIVGARNGHACLEVLL